MVIRYIPRLVLVAVGASVAVHSAERIPRLSSLLADAEVRDRFMYGIPLLFVLGLGATRAFQRVATQEPTTRTMFLVDWLGICLFVYAWSQVTVYGTLAGRLWFGFGPTVAATGIAVGASVLPLLLRLNASPDTTSGSRIRRTTLGLSAALAVWYLPSLIQTPRGVMDHIHSWYVINEVIGHAIGNNFMGEHVHQYSNVIGAPLALVRFLGLSRHIGPISLWYLVTLAVLSVGALIAVTARTLSNKWRHLAVLLVLPIGLVKGTSDEIPTGSISVLFSALPVRTLFIFVTALVLTGSHLSTRRRTWILGFVGGLAVLNNLEFAIASLCALGITLIRFEFSRRLITDFVLAITTGVLAALLTSLAVLGDSPTRWLPNIAIIRSFGGGFGAVQAPEFGLHLAILSVFSAAALVGKRATAMRTPNIGGVGLDPLVGRTEALLLSYFGLTGLLAFPYFVNRSVVSGQLQLFLLFLPPIFAAFLMTFLRQRNLNPASHLRIRDYLAPSTVMSALLVGVSLAPLIDAPNARYELRRNFGDGSAIAMFALEQRRLDELGETVGLHGGWQNVDQMMRWGNWVEAVTQARNVSVLSNPAEYWYLDQSVRTLQCRVLGDSPSLIVVDDFFEAGEPLCSGFEVVATFDERTHIVRREPTG